jgi:SAM-dependent methyltransferase
VTETPSLADIFEQHTGRLIYKWSHYFPVYERYLSRFRQSPVRVLEIGVWHGGSLQMWKRYFGEYASLVGVDIDPRCRDYVEDGIEIEIGDQSDPAFWCRVIDTHGDFDIVIDDGSHVAEHQRASFLSLWPHLRDLGVYVVEDCHTAYWPDYGGGVRHPASFIEFAKEKVDELNALWSRDPGKLMPTPLTFDLAGISFHDSMVVLEKRRRTSEPRPIARGTLSRPEPDLQGSMLTSLGGAPDR